MKNPRSKNESSKIALNYHFPLIMISWYNNLHWWIEKIKGFFYGVLLNILSGLVSEIKTTAQITAQPPVSVFKSLK